MLEFIRLRFENDSVAAGSKQEVVIAATSVAFDDVLDCKARIDALQNISSREQFGVLAGSYKRIRNIIKDNSSATVDESLFSEDGEKQLHATLLDVKTKVEPLLQSASYDEALETMLLMKEPVGLFCEHVMVMTDDTSIRQNRLNLLNSLGELVLRVGDISRMHLEGSA